MRYQLVFVAAVFLAAACGNSQAKGAAEPSNARVDELAERLDSVDTRLKKIETVLSDILDEPHAPDPTAVYAVPIERDPYSGQEQANVTMVEAFEFACPYCAEAWPTMKQLLKDSPDDLKVVYKYYVVHQQAVLPGLSACAAQAQGKFSEMTQLIWDKGFGAGDLGAPRMEMLAGEVGLDIDRYRKDIEGDACKEWLKRDYVQLNGLGVNGTPVFYINGRYVSGAQPISVFKRFIDEELAKANKAIGAGTPVESYYQKAVLDAGKPKL